MKTNPQPDNVRLAPDRPVTARQELSTLMVSGAVCHECLNEDFDSCVCPEPEN